MFFRAGEKPTYPLGWMDTEISGGFIEYIIWLYKFILIDPQQPEETLKPIDRSRNPCPNGRITTNCFGDTKSCVRCCTGGQPGSDGTKACQY